MSLGGLLIGGPSLLCRALAYLATYSIFGSAG
jgi:hypothetical protein